MKWVKPVIAVAALLGAMFFAYQSFESSFNPRRGHEHESGQHGMSPAMIEMMKKMPPKKTEDAGAKAKAAGAGKKSGPDVASHKKAASEQTQKEGGE